MVEIITEKKQRFLGEDYYLCGFYFQRNGKRLHRAVYEYYKGKIPQGFHVHHIDGDRTNNGIENLELLQKGDHSRLHMQQPERKKDAQRAIKIAIEAAKAWHGSQAGYEWHRKHYEQCKDKLHTKKIFTCECCGKEFEAEDVGTNKFCSKNCKAMHRRRSGVDNETRICVVCGAEFIVNKYIKTKCCSRTCGGALRRSYRAQRNAA